MRKLLLAVIAAAFILAPSTAGAYWLDIGAGYWNPTPSGTVGYTSPMQMTLVPNLAIDLDKDLGMDKAGAAQVRVKADLPLLNVGLMATPLEFEGKKIITLTDLDFGLKTYTISTEVKSKVVIDHYDFTLFFTIPLLETATLNTFNIEFGLNARMVDLELTLSSDLDPLLKETKALSTTIPMAYAGVQITPVDSFAIEAEYRGLAVGDNKYTDAMGKLKWKPVPLFNISAGYRAEKLEIDDEGIKSDMEFKGPFAELGFQF